MTYQDIKAALEIFGLGERATLKQIKSKHRSLVKTHHPDHAVRSDPDLIKKINAAYELLCHYCENYRFSFSEEEFFEQHPEERIKRQFGWDSVWGGDKEENV